MSLQSVCARSGAIAPRDQAATTFVVTPRVRVSAQNLWVIYAGLGIGAFLIQTVALGYGLWPLSIFIGLDAAALIVAVHVHRLCQEHRREEIAIVGSQVVVRSVSFRRPMREVRMPLRGLCLTRCERRSGHCRQVLLNSGTTQIEIGRDLTSHERAGFAAALTQALGGEQTPVAVNVSRPTWLLFGCALGW